MVAAADSAVILPLAASAFSVSAVLALAAAAAVPSRASNSLTRQPACAATWAIPAPMVPAPMTPTVLESE